MEQADPLQKELLEKVASIRCDVCKEPSAERYAVKDFDDVVWLVCQKCRHNTNRDGSIVQIKSNNDNKVGNSD